MNRWLIGYAKAAELSDMFRGRPDHIGLIAAGLFGEAGSVLADARSTRDGDNFPGHSNPVSVPGVPP